MRVVDMCIVKMKSNKVPLQILYLLIVLVKVVEKNSFS
jgi:hypothetical protein